MNKNKIIECLKEKNVTEPCNRCGEKHFEVVKDGYILTKSLDGVPVAIIACSNCGFIMLHALSVLT